MSIFLDMTLTELKYIVTLSQEKHFGRAAERCFVSQPTLSIAVKKLERELDVTIFERNKSAITLTPIGAQIITQAQRILEESSALTLIANSGKDQLSTPLRIGAIYTIGPYLFPHLIPQLQNIAPNMQLYIEENFTAVLRQKLRDGELDAIIIALPFTESDVLTKAIYDEAFVALLPAQHPWADMQSISPNQLLDENLLLLGQGHCFRDQVLDLCPALHKNTQQQKRIEGSSLETLRHMVASGMGITVLPESATGSHYAPGLLTTTSFHAPVPTRTVAIAWRASFPRPKAIDAVVEAANQCRLS